ncbi:amidohydrolase family protein [Rhodohalobacter sp.]|uniref:amidohydrolase family protein n=1 Tax=Rhodohalobacter sp. TaxID=1974210 RepID=UPI002ACEA5C0|nr:amidohydrolase family protein [Rhodohalobacter sp.]MDZ7756343.1 amidohydrolase family protein [Rhodohalobacter sp.]
MKHLQIITFFIAISMLSACSGSQSTKTLFTGSNIIDIETGEISEGQSILIEDGVISSIFPDGSQNLSGAESISMDGKYVIPGLWDMHIHLRGGDDLINSNRELLPLFIANGVTTVRDAGGDLTSSIYDWRIEIESNMLTGPFIYTSGPKIDGTDPTWEGSIEVTNAEEISSALDSLQDLGVDYIKIYESKLSGENYLEIVRQTEERGLIVTGHMPMDILIEDAIEAGLDGIEHLYYVMKGTSLREAEITEMVRNGEIGFWQAVAELKRQL